MDFKLIPVFFLCTYFFPSWQSVANLRVGYFLKGDCANQTDAVLKITGPARRTALQFVAGQSSDKRLTRNLTLPFESNKENNAAVQDA